MLGRIVPPRPEKFRVLHGAGFAGPWTFGIKALPFGSCMNVNMGGHHSGRVPHCQIKQDVMSFPLDMGFPSE